MRIFPALLVLAALAATALPAWAQYGQRNAFTPAGQRLSAAQVRTELENRLNRNPNPADPATIWNTGYDFFRNFPRNQDTARAIMDGFLGTLRGQRDPDRRRVLLQAAIYWEKIHDYGIINVPAGQDFNTRDKIYYGDYSKFSTLGLVPGGRRPPAPTTRGDWPGRVLNRRHPYQGRPDNPYPGAYWPGLYPP
ncbi:MAG: hypothetical protein LBC90_00785 [Candidatus Adiutrix sp.]|nr:hypothetical protein [Candidatus Adiutrix sp.]